MYKLIRTAPGALEPHFERLSSGRYRRRLRNRRAPRTPRGGHAPIKAT